MLLTRYRSLSTSTRSNRIEPERPQRSRLATLVRALAGFVLLALLGSVLFQRSSISVIPVPPINSADSMRLTLDGAISVEAGERRSLTISSSYLLAGPTVTSEIVTHDPVTSKTTPRRGWVAGCLCSTLGPCRLSSKVATAQGDQLELIANDGPVLIRTFEGALKVSVLDEKAGVSIGWYEGPLAVSTVAGTVEAVSLSSEFVSIATEDGAVTVVFRTAPKELSVEAGSGPVTVRLPEGSYNVKVTGAESQTVDVDEAVDAKSNIWIEAEGVVTVTAKQAASN